MDIDLDFGPKEDSLDIRKEEVAVSTDLPWLRQAYRQLSDSNLEVAEFLTAFRHAEIDDEAWFRRAAGRYAFGRIASRWIERRILMLGEVPDYPPMDPRSRQLRILNEKVEKLTRELEQVAARPVAGAGRDC
jgi:hypothetical protein